MPGEKSAPEAKGSASDGARRCTRTPPQLPRGPPGTTTQGSGERLSALRKKESREKSTPAGCLGARLVCDDRSANNPIHPRPCEARSWGSSLLQSQLQSQTALGT